MAKKVALVFGAVFILVGILGFIPNPIVGMGAIFDTNHLHDAVHLLFGIILLAIALKVPAKSAKWLKIVGVIYLLIALLGFVLVPSGGLLLGFVETNHADHWLHIVLGVILLGVGLWAGKGAMREMDMPSSMPPSGGMPTSNSSM